jgi:glucose-6-phosphate 1-dehydrogenase
MANGAARRSEAPVHRLTPNDLTLHIQPEEGVSLRFGA